MKQSPSITPVILAGIILTPVKGKSKCYFKKLLDKDTYSNKRSVQTLNFTKMSIEEIF